MSATCYKKLNSMNVLQDCPSDFVTEPAPGYTCDIWFHNLGNIEKKCHVASASKSIPSVAAASPL